MNATNQTATAKRRGRPKERPTKTHRLPISFNKDEWELTVNLLKQFREKSIDNTSPRWEKVRELIEQIPPGIFEEEPETIDQTQIKQFELF